jgi:hypothetical protein
MTARFLQSNAESRPVFARALFLWEKVAEGQVRVRQHGPHLALRATFSQREKARARHILLY